jgi:hypothetical protein
VTALVLAGVLVLVGVLAGALAVVLGACVIAGRASRDESRLDDEFEVARSLGYPMYPAWQARKNGGERPEDPVA